eukprot:469514-Rhodomonas_salina.2
MRSFFVPAYAPLFVPAYVPLLYQPTRAATAMPSTVVLRAGGSVPGVAELPAPSPAPAPGPDTETHRETETYTQARRHTQTHTHTHTHTHTGPKVPSHSIDGGGACIS